MIRFVSLLLFFPLSAAVHAQTADSLVTNSIVSSAAAPPLLWVADTPRTAQLLPYFSIQEQLRQVAGVQATPYTGAPGAQAVVRLRGAASLGRNAQPLYVIDGVPVWQHHTIMLDGNTPTTPVESFELNSFLTLPTEDILRVEVLKGAYETAEYGAQGQNGVIRITTKRGQSGKPQLTYSGYAGVQQSRSRYDLLTAREYASLVNESDTQAGKPPRYTPEQLAAFGRGTDWQQEVLRPAVMHQHYLAWQGGGQRTTYYGSAAYGQQQGIVENSGLRTLNLRAAAEHRFTSKLALGANVMTSAQQAQLPADDIAAAMVLALPTQDAHTPTGELAETAYSEDNPLRYARLSYRTPRQHYALAQLHLRYTVLPYLTVELRANGEWASQRLSKYQTPNPSLNKRGGLVLKQQATHQQWNMLPAIYFNRTFASHHQVQVWLSSQRQYLAQDDRRTVYMDNSTVFVYSNPFSHRLTTHQLTGTYQFKRRYEVNFSLRQDAAQTSDVLHSQQRTRKHYLPGAQLKWHVGQEKWLVDHSPIHTLDAWIGWGSTTNAGNFSTYNQLAFVTTTGGGHNARYVPVEEYTQQQEAGLSLGLWQDHLLITAAAYDRRTMLGGRPENALTLQPSLTLVTYGHLRNQGGELTISTRWQLGRLQGTSALAAATNRNQFRAGELKSYKISDEQIIRDGAPLSTFYVLHYTGVDAATGEPSYQDTDGNGRLDTPDRVAASSGLPRQLLAFTQTLQLGRFRLQAQADGMLGYRMDASYLNLLAMPNTYTNSTRATLHHWTPSTPKASLPSVGYATEPTSDFAVRSGNHARLTALTVEYKIWAKEAHQIVLWAGCHNLFVVSRYPGYDPNVSSGAADNTQAGLDQGAYPVARTVLLGVRATL